MQNTYTPPSNALLWFSILAGPAAWSAHLSIEYFLTTAECYLSSGDPSPLPLVSSVALAAVALAGAAAGWRARHAAMRSPDPDSTATRRRRFMATSGVLLSVLFLVGIVMATIPILFLEPCLAGV